MSAHHWGKAFAKRWVLCCVPNIVGLEFSPSLAVRSLTNGDVLLHFLLGWVIIGWGWGEEENVLFWGFFNDKGCPVSLKSGWCKKKKKKEQTFEVFKTFFKCNLMHAKTQKKALYCHEWISGGFSFGRGGDWQNWSCTKYPISLPQFPSTV